MLFMTGIFFFIIAIVGFAVHCPNIRLELIDDWKTIHKKASSVLAVVTGFFAFLPAISEQVLSALPQIQSIEGLPWLTAILESAQYRTGVGFMTLLIVVARAVKVPAKVGD